MRHKWKSVNQGIEGIGNYGKRICENCGAVQTKHATHSWMRITGYRWEPLAGKCKKSSSN